MLYLTKNKIFYDNKEVKSFIPYLCEFVELEKNFTLKHLFNFIERDAELINIIFASHLGRLSLQPFLNEIKKEPTRIDDDLKNIILERSAEIDNYENNDYPYIEETISVSSESKNKFKHMNYGIEYVPLNNLKHLSIKLNKIFQIYDMTKDDKKDIVLLKAEKEYTMYEIIGEILYELSFAGEPEYRDEKFKEIKEEINKSKEKIRKDKNE